jgi:ABC-type nickel/cobalt efflux system permease component RcnA
LRLLAALAASLFALCGEAVAHPLGNFSINHLTVVRPVPGRVELRYVLDLAEIPTYALLREYDAAGRPGPALLNAIARRQAEAVLPKLHVRVDGREVPLAFASARASLRRGAGGLPTFYVNAAYRTAAVASGALSVADDSFPERIGWHDVVLAGSAEPTHALTAYPPAEAGSPRNVRVIRIDGAWSPGAHVVVDAGASEPATPAASNVRSNQLADLLARGTSDPALVAFALLVALGLGMLHALEPGHGKALMAVSLVGARATVRQAAILALALTVAHTAAVLALGVLLHVFKGWFVPEQIYPWIALGSGLVVVCVAALALARNVPRGTAGETHEAAMHSHDAHLHAHDGHTHAHGNHTHAHDDHAHDDHAHAHGGRSHSHAIPGSAPLRLGPAVAAAVSGGIAPCPAALVVLLASLALGQAAYGLAMVLAFSLGLALTLVGIGVGVVRGARFLSGVPAFERYLPYAPVASALAMAAVGALLVGRGLVDVGAPLPPYAGAALVACAIAAFTLLRPLSQTRVPAHAHPQTPARAESLS